MSTDPIDGHPDDAEIIECAPGPGRLNRPASRRRRPRRSCPRKLARGATYPGAVEACESRREPEAHAGLHWHRSRYHGVRVPMYAGKTVLYTMLGVTTLSGMLRRRWDWTERRVLESQAVAAGARVTLRRCGPTHRDSRHAGRGPSSPCAQA